MDTIEKLITNGIVAVVLFVLLLAAYSIGEYNSHRRAYNLGYAEGYATCLTKDNNDKFTIKTESN